MASLDIFSFSARVYNASFPKETQMSGCGRLVLVKLYAKLSNSFAPVAMNYFRNI